MIRHETIVISETTITKTKVLCDECGAHAFTKCVLCNADICVKHRYFKREQGCSDYDEFVCSYCAEITKTTQFEIDELENKIEELIDKRRATCIANRKELNRNNTSS